MERILRSLAAIRRPTADENQRGLRERGETLESFTVRDASRADLGALVDLHVKSWNATYPHVSRKPTHAIRETQWRHAFDSDDRAWCCFVVEGGAGELVGFANGVRSADPRYDGQMSKIYMLRDYQRLGFGRRLMGHVARHFLEHGISSMILFSEISNPSGAFYERLGADRVLDEAGKFHGAYGWSDLDALATRCPVDG